MKILYHTPVPLNPSSSVGCGIRPIKMLEAFQEIGCDVTVIAGYGAERKKVINEVKRSLAKGVRYDFCYSESPPLPTLLTEQHRFPIYPFLDFNFFSFLKKNNVPIGLFYRDIYWLVGDPPKEWGRLKNSIANYFYRYDLDKYSKLVDILYLPTKKMGDYLESIPDCRKKALPPGLTSLSNSYAPGVLSAPLKLLYVGGMGENYKMHELFRALEDADAKFTLCTRVNEWGKIRGEYEPYMADKVKVVHKSGGELDELYEKNDIAMLFMEPDEYREFAAPLKLYEYLGRLKPIIATRGTHAATFVEDNGIGWVIDYKSSALVDLLLYLNDHPNEVLKAAMRCKEIADSHTWIARAKHVILNFKESRK